MLNIRRLLRHKIQNNSSLVSIANRVTVLTQQLALEDRFLDFVMMVTSLLYLTLLSYPSAAIVASSNVGHKPL
jgi:uncharacterized membrane protein